jgi:hypothetical protein
MNFPTYFSISSLSPQHKIPNIHAQLHPWRICFMYGLWIVVNSFNVIISLNSCLCYHGENKMITCQYSLVHLYRGRQQWKKRPFMVIMVHKLAYAYNVITRSCTIAQVVRCQFHIVEAWIQFQDSLSEIVPD